ncbi:MAG: NAD-dependent epimerase/dehydratase family protein [Clostridia bacterium]|nr:NAD-dependent epimerase/dehydratase family protein [Clostridia bacterium]
MKNLLVTGGTVFVSRFAAQYFAEHGYNVFVLNRNTKPQPENVTLIEADRHNLGDKLKGYHFDAVLDITAYDREDVADLLTALDSFDDYIFISSSAVYPETLEQPFKEEQQTGANSIWGKYGTNKIEAEEYLKEHLPQAYILRPPYLYGPMQNAYREPFVFDCAREKRPFFIPKDGKMKLQFFHVEDLCRFMEILMEKHPVERIYNVGNPESVDINTWVGMCYDAAGEKLESVNVTGDHEQRSYFSFYDYEYELDVSRQSQLLPQTKSLAEGLGESFEWYCEHENAVTKKAYFEYIDKELR